MPTFNYDSVINIYNRDSGKMKFATPQNLFIPKPGEEYMVRILPGGEGYVSNVEHFFETTARHRLIGTNVRKSIGCLKIMKDERCPVCNFVSMLYNLSKSSSMSNSESLRNLASSIKRYTRFVFNVIIRGQEDRGVLVWSVGKKLRENILAGIQRLHSRNQEWDITHPETGRDYNVIVEESAGYPDYSKSSFDFSPSPLAGSKEEIDAILAKRFDLRQYQPKVFSQSETETILAEYLEDIGRSDLSKLITNKPLGGARSFTLSDAVVRSQQGNNGDEKTSLTYSEPLEEQTIDDVVEDLEISIPSTEKKDREQDIGTRLQSLIDSIKIE